MGFLIWALMLDVNIDVDFIVFFVRFNFLAVIDIDCHVKWLVVHFLAFDLRSFGGILGIRLAHRHA